MIEFDYNLDYKNTLFEPNDKRYRIGRGEQGVLLVRPYTDIICKHWRFKNPFVARTSSRKIYEMFESYKRRGDFIGMDMCRKFLEMGFTRARRYANHRDGRKYDKNGYVIPQEVDALTCEKAQSARIHKHARDRITNDEIYKTMRKEWRKEEQEYADIHI